MNLVLFTDASFDRRSGAGGLGVYMPDLNGEEVALSLQVSDLMDCNHGEVNAVYSGLLHLFSVLSPAQTETLSLSVYTDSDHAYALLTKQRNPTTGRDNEARCVAGCHHMTSQLSSCHWHCLKSHRQAGPLSLSNERADRLAKKAMRACRDSMRYAHTS